MDALASLLLVVLDGAMLLTPVADRRLGRAAILAMEQLLRTAPPKDQARTVGPEAAWPSSARRASMPR